MVTQDLESLRYPLGRFQLPETFDQAFFLKCIKILEELPKRLSLLVNELTDNQLDTPYRTEGWTIRQVIHHIADSHHHSYIRFKWALTEDEPVIKAYNEQDWAELLDGKLGPIQLSLDHIKGVHGKLVYLLKGMSKSDFEKCFIHPEHQNKIPLKVQVGLYAWHSKHHYAHIENLLKRKEWI